MADRFGGVPVQQGDRFGGVPVEEKEYDAVDDIGKATDIMKAKAMSPVEEDTEAPYKWFTVGVGAMTGAELGFKAGSMLPHPAAKLAGGAIGGIIGSMGGSTFADMANDTPPTETVANALREGTVDAAFGFGVPALTQVAKNLGHTAINSILKIDPQIAEDMLSTAKQIGAKYGIENASHWAPIKGIKTIFGVFPFVGTPFRTQATQNTRAVSNTLDDYLNAVAPNGSLTEAGVDMVAAAKNSFDDFKRVSASMFEYADDFANAVKAKIPSRSIKNAANFALDRSTLPAVKDGKFPEIGNSVVDDFVKATSKIELDNLSIKEVRALERDISSLFKREGLDDIDRRRLTIVKKGVEDAWPDLMSVSDETTVKARELYSKAKGFYGTNMAKYQSATAKKIGRVDKSAFRAGAFKSGTLEEDELARQAFNLKSKDSITALKSVVGDEPVRKALRNHIETAIQNSIQHVGEEQMIFNAANLKRNLGMTKGVYSREALEEALKGSGVKSRDFEKLLDFAEQIGEVPLASKFVARRAVLGGAKSGLRALLGGGLAYSVGASNFPQLVAMVGMARMGANALTDPRMLKRLISISDNSIPQSIRSAQAARLVKMMITADEITVPPEIRDEWDKQTDRIIGPSGEAVSQ